jgi:hypothetical protein
MLPPTGRTIGILSFGVAGDATNLVGPAASASCPK